MTLLLLDILLLRDDSVVHHKSSSPKTEIDGSDWTLVIEKKLIDLREIETNSDPESKRTLLAARQLRDAIIKDCQGNLLLREVSSEARKIFARIQKTVVDRKRTAIAKNIETRRRIIAVIKAASQSENPALYEAEIRKCRSLWISLDPLGSRGPNLQAEFRSAYASFRRKVNKKHPS